MSVPEQQSAGPPDVKARQSIVGTIAAPFSYIDKQSRHHFSLYSALRQCKFVHWRSAFTEIWITLLFTLLPLWVPLIALPMFGNLNTPIYSMTYDQIKNGELYIMSAALLTPLYYFTFPNVARTSRTQPVIFPSQQLLILIFMGTVLLASLAIAATRVQAASHGIPSGMITLSVWLFTFCSVVLFLAIAVRNGLPDTATSELDFISQDETRRFPPQGRPLDTSPVDPDEMIAETLRAHAVGGDGVPG